MAFPNSLPRFDQPPLRLLGVTAIIFVLVSALLHSAVHGTHINLGGRGFGFAFVLLLFFGPRLWPCIVVGTAAAYLATGQDALAALTTGLSNGLATALAVSLMNSHGFNRSLSRLKDYYMLLLYGTLLAPGISAAIGAFLPVLLGVAAPDKSLDVYAEWWMGDSMGLLNAAPALLIWFSGPRNLPRARYGFEFAGLLFIAASITAVIFGHQLHDLFAEPIPSFLLMALIAWAAVVFGRHVTSLLIVVFFSLVLASIRNNTGLFADERHYATLLNLWLFISLFSIVGMTLAIVLHQLRQAQEELRDNESNFRTLAESASVMIWLNDTSQQRNWFNRAWLEFTGHALEEETGSGWRAGIHPDDLDELQKIADDAWADRTPYTHEYRLRHHEGSYRIVMEQAAPRFGNDGEFLGYTGSCQDVTTRRDAEQALAERERMLRVIYNNSNIAIAFFGPDGHLGHANQCMAEMFNCPPDKLIGREYLDLVHPQERETARDGVNRILNGEVDQASLERLYQRLDGLPFWGQMNCRVLRDEAEQVFGIIVVIADISARKAAEAELRLAAQVFANSHEGIVIVDAQNRIVSVNEAFTTITGYAAAEAIGQTPELLRSGRHDASMYEKMISQLNEIGHWDGEAWNRRKDGSIFPVQLSISTVRDCHGNIESYISIFSDITERKASEDRIRHMAQYDFLTDLPNRALLLDRLTHELANAKRYDKLFAMMFIDLDHFKPINDQHGHDVGDLLLCEVAQRLKDNVRDSDTVSRQGGDEFIILVTNLTETEQTVQFGQKLLRILAEPYHIAGHELRITPSIGIAIYPHDGEDIDTLIKGADTAMYRAKGAGRNNLQCHGHDSNTPWCDAQL